jgi:hypothetical protein
MSQSTWLDSLTERLVVALVSGIVAALTLALYPVALLILGRGAGGGAEVELGAHFYAFMFSKVGLVVIISASLAGFFFGPERMANIFSFFWGTHNFWKTLGADTEDKFSEFKEEHNFKLWLLVILLAVFAFVMFSIHA